MTFISIKSNFGNPSICTNFAAFSHQPHRVTLLRVKSSNTASGKRPGQLIVSAAYCNSLHTVLDKSLYRISSGKVDFRYSIHCSSAFHLSMGMDAATRITT